MAARSKILAASFSLEAGGSGRGLSVPSVLVIVVEKVKVGESCYRCSFSRIRCATASITKA